MITLRDSAAAAVAELRSWWRRIPDTRRMRRDWYTARSLADLGELTARWLEGEWDQMPGYGGPPDPETLPLVPTLVRANRAGFVTNDSQPGRIGYSGLWRQRAVVMGFIGDPVLLSLLTAECAAAGLPVYSRRGAPRWLEDYSASVPVTQELVGPDDWDTATDFGAVLSARSIRELTFQDCHRAAQDDAVAAWQVTVVDMEWGRNDVLWPVLDRVVEQHRAARIAA